MCINCWYGNEIIVESESIYQAAYHVGWEELKNNSLNIKSYLILIMQRAQRPLKLTLGGFINLSVDLLISTVKAVYSYYTFLSKV